MHAKLHSCNLQAVEKQQQLDQRVLHLFLLFLCVKMSHAFLSSLFWFLWLVSSCKELIELFQLYLDGAVNWIKFPPQTRLAPYAFGPHPSWRNHSCKISPLTSEARVLSFHLKIIIPTYSKTYFTIEYCKSKRYSNNLYYQWGVISIFQFCT